MPRHLCSEQSVSTTGAKTKLTAVIVLAAPCLLLGCGGGAAVAPPSPPSPMVTVTVVGPSETLNTGSSFTLTATVHNASNSAVTWSVVEAAGGSITAAGVYAAPATPGTYTVKATSQADRTASGTAPARVVIPVAHIAGYDVGVDYHAYGINFDQTAFVTIYNQPQVRQAVQTQLQGMADRGATFLHTSIWFVTTPGTTNFGETWRATFPITDQEAANLRAYAQDVATVQGSGGNRLRLDIALEWLGASDYTIGSPSTGLGYTPIPAAEFISNIETTTDKVLAAVSNVTRPDGVRAVDAIYFDDEVMIGAKANEDWFLSTNYPRFVSVLSQARIRPTVYFDSDFSQNAVLDDGWIDPLYPILNGHRSMYWIYRSMKFMVDQGLPIPSRIDSSIYMTSTGASYDQLLQRILDDADATLPSLGAPRVYGAAETYYFADPNQRLQYAQAFATQAAQNPRLQRVSFWTTPDGGGPGANLAYPFTIEDFFPPAP
jgi:hypothetical protein